MSMGPKHKNPNQCIRTQNTKIAPNRTVHLCLWTQNTKNNLCLWAQNTKIQNHVCGPKTQKPKNHAYGPETQNSIYVHGPKTQIHVLRFIYLIWAPWDPYLFIVGPLGPYLFIFRPHGVHIYLIWPSGAHNYLFCGPVGPICIYCWPPGVLLADANTLWHSQVLEPATVRRRAELGYMECEVWARPRAQASGRLRQL